ncbi:rhomboid-related intramembrane serine protease family protein [Artemisia annua]|uniref:Rhomboid-related intramembrane serine protease family protein n=1 Tax=Artemisia annua TaxID=35608 RepID=A0A2U1QMB9_ARTAN|nr:rhomboid-related intramembrane serine protease family protein [Artemisia annua]
MSIATKLFSLKRICQNPRKVVSETLQSNPLRVDRPTRHGYHSSTKNLARLPLPFKQLLHKAAYLKPKPSSNDHGYFGSQFRRYISSKSMLTFGQVFNYTESHVRRIAKTHGALIGLIAANVGVHLLWKVADTRFMRQNFRLQLDGVKSGRFHTMITYAFSHADDNKILGCLLCLCLFGKGIGDKFGPKVLLKLYLAGAFAGSAFFLAHKAFLAQSSENKEMSKSDPSKVPGMGGIAAFTSVTMFRLIMLLREKIHSRSARVKILGICVVLNEILQIAAQKYRNKNSTMSLAYANLGGLAVALMVGAPVLAGARLRKWRC